MWGEVAGVWLLCCKSRKKRSIIGQIGGGKHLPSGVVDIALVPALFEKGDLPGEKRVADLVGS